ncbi:MAG TPA: aryl-sulfate sulfotransferase [Longilinea sp.]|nr:aryl-sulfate sulfotransferase [Longilinea sp.]
MNLKKAWLLGAAAVVGIALLALAFLLLNLAYAPAAETLSAVKAAIDKQQKIEADIQSYYQAGNFTFDNPLVIQDPYQAAPLTALVIFDTPEDSQITIHLPGKTLDAAVDYTFSGFRKHHEIPIYGLYAGTLNHITLSLKTQNGDSHQTEIDLQTETLPVYIQTITVDEVDHTQYNPGFNLALDDHKTIFDVNGDVRWYATQASFQVLTPLENGRFLFTYSVGDHKEGNLVMEQDLLGKVYAVYNVDDGINHEIYELPSGNLLITTSDLKSDTVQDHLIEVDPQSGHVVRTFDMKKYLDSTRPTSLDSDTNDWLHLNSIVYDPTDDTIIISSRSQSAVIKMTYPGMQIKWILGPHDNWSAKYQPYLLTPIGDNFEWPWSQHHATLYGPDVAGDNTVDILLFDNGLYRSFNLATAYSPAEWYSRLVHYRINEADMTVEQVWDYGKQYGGGSYSLNKGSAFLLPNGDILGTWGTIARDSQGKPTADISDGNVYTTKIVEVDPATDKVAFAGTIPDTSTYRTLRIGFYDKYSENNDYLSTPINNTSSNDLIDRGRLAGQDIYRLINSNPLSLFVKRALRHFLK